MTRDEALKMVEGMRVLRNHKSASGNFKANCVFTFQSRMFDAASCLHVTRELPCALDTSGLPFITDDDHVDRFAAAARHAYLYAMKQFKQELGM